MTAHPYHKKLARVLERMGGLYTVNDILAEIAANRMQSFVEGDSWLITRVSLYPRGKALEIVAALGDRDEVLLMVDRLPALAAEIGAGVIQTYGRKGWFRELERRGWRIKAENYVYQKDVEL